MFNRTHFLILFLALAVRAPIGQAQSSSRNDARRQRSQIALVVRPAPGEVFELLIEQTVEMSGVRRDPMPMPSPGSLGASDIAVAPEVGPRRNSKPGRITVMTVHGHSTVESRSATGTVVRAALDSMFLRAGDMGSTLSSQRVELTAGAGVSRVLVSPNGAMRLIDDGSEASAVGSTLSAMPAMLPDGLVEVGDTWEHEVELPPLPFSAYRTDGVLHTTFRLDSVSGRNGDAWVSVTGSMRRDGPTRDLPVGTRVITAGTMQGTLRFTRGRSWITEANTTVFLQSEIVSPGDGAPPMHLGIRLTQHMRMR